MSPANKESSGDRDDEGPSNSSDTLSSSTCCSGSSRSSGSSGSPSGSNSGSTSCSGSGSDNDGEGENLNQHRHRHCQKSKETDDEKDLPHHHSSAKTEQDLSRAEHGIGDRNEVIDRLQSTATSSAATTTGQMCDTSRTDTINCTCGSTNQSKPVLANKSQDQKGICCNCCLNEYETTSTPTSAFATASTSTSTSMKAATEPSPCTSSSPIPPPPPSQSSQSNSQQNYQAQPITTNLDERTTEPVKQITEIRSLSDKCESLFNRPSSIETEQISTRNDRQQQQQQNEQQLDVRYTKSTSPGFSCSNLSSTTSTTTTSQTVEPTQSRRTLKPAPSPSPSLPSIDTNNNKNNNNNNNSSLRDGLSSIKRTNFSKSASGGRLMNRGRPNVCDCLSQDCAEKKHSNRRQFIEHYYNSRTQLPTANKSTSSFNISTPLNRLSECDAITKRLLSSPIRTSANQVESPTRRAQVSDVDKSRRASLGTNTMTDQVFLFTSNPFKSLELSHLKKTKDNGADNQHKYNVLKESGPQTSDGGENDVKLKHLHLQQQQQSRSLSVCDEETLNPRHRGSSSNHSSNLNRAVSLACESRPPPLTGRLLTIIPLFGCDMKSLEQFTKLGLILPPVIDSIVDHILVNGVNSIGIFRKSGVKSRILTLRQRIEANQNVKFDELNQGNEFSIYDIADLVKMWFRELKPVPLMTKELIKLISAFLNSTQNSQAPMVRGDSSQQDITSASGRSSNTPASITRMKYVDPSLRNNIDSMITSTHRALLLRALECLAQISSKCNANQMTSQNLAICLTPSLCATESDQNSILIAQKALEFSIDNHGALFGNMELE